MRILYFSMIFFFLSFMLFVMLRGLITLSLTKAVTQSSLSFCMIFRHVLLQIKVFSVVIHLVADWLGSWLITV